MANIGIPALKELIPLLQSAQVRSFKWGSIEIEFSNHIKELDKPSPGPVKETKAEPFVQPDLKADDMMDYDKVLHWSGSGPDGTLPLTGEEDIQRLAAP